MNPEYLSLADFLVTNSILAWLGLRMVKRIDDLNQRVDKHETRITLAERELEYAKENSS